MQHNVCVVMVTNQRAHLGFTVGLLGVADGGVGHTVFRTGLHGGDNMAAQGHGHILTADRRVSLGGRVGLPLFLLLHHLTSLFIFGAHSLTLKTELTVLYS